MYDFFVLFIRGRKYQKVALWLYKTFFIVREIFFLSDVVKMRLCFAFLSIPRCVKIFVAYYKAAPQKAA